MTAPKPLPARPSLDSLRKQARKLARDAAAGDAGAIARARAHLPAVTLPLTHRQAQLVVAREYGCAGWPDLTAEVSRRLGRSLEWAAAQARRIIHDNDLEGLTRLLAEYPALLTWQHEDEPGGLVGMATGAYGDAGDPQREQWFTRPACAELLIDAGAVVPRAALDGILQSRAKGLLELFGRKGLLPRTLRFRAALGDLDGLRTLLEEHRHDRATLNDAFLCACRFRQEAAASILLERSIGLEPDLGRRIDQGPGQRAFVAHFMETARPDVNAAGLWLAFAMDQIARAARDGDVAGLVDGLRREPRLLGGDRVGFQDGLIGSAAMNGHGPIIAALFDLDPAILRREPPPPSQALELAFTYGNTHLVPWLTRIWTIPDDLPHAAGMGDLSRVTRWFDAAGRPALGDVRHHAPATSVHPREPQWGDVGVQEVLDTALAWAVVNRHFDVADFLLEHGADVNTNWNSHEPASILHHLVFLPDPHERMRFLIDRGIDLTITDYRWKSTARGWARYGKDDPELAAWLEAAERERERSD